MSVELEQKDPNESVTFSDLKEAHENLEEEWSSALSTIQEKVNKYEDQEGHIPSDVKEQLDRVNDRLDELEQIKKRSLEGYQEGKERQEKTEAAKAYGEFVRKGGPGNPMSAGVDHETMQKLQSAEGKGLATDSNVDGGYLVPENTRDEIIAKRRAVSPVREFATVLTISEGNQLKIPREDDTDFEAGWTGERESRPETDHSGFEMLNIPTHEMYAKPLATQQMLDDPSFDIEAWLEQKVADKFSRKEGTAFVVGNGANKPEGILDDVAASRQVPSGASQGITYGDSTSGLLGLVYDIEIDEYVQNATLMMNRRTVAGIRGITDNNDMPIWSPGLGETDPPNILGFQYFTATDMPTLGTDGNNAIVFGDLSMAYYIVDRADIRFLRDPFSSKPHVEFYYTTRVGGQVVLPEALRFLKVGTS
jgi:HK97 family phage major capsid protein